MQAYNSSNNTLDSGEKVVPPSEDTAVKPDDQIEKDRAFAENVLTSSTVEPKLPEKVASPKVINLRATGGLANKLEPLPEVTVHNVQEAGSRVTALKRRVNMLKSMTDSEGEKEQMLMMVLCCLFLGPIGIMLAMCLFMAQGGNPSIKAPIADCLGQINTLRNAFSDDQHFWDLDRREQIQEDIFQGGNAVRRDLLTGPL